MIDEKKLQEWKAAAKAGMNYDNCNDDDLDKLCEAVPALIAEVERLRSENMRLEFSVQGTWPRNDIRRVFVSGAKWWEFHKTGATMWRSDIDLVEAEADKKYPEGKMEAAK